MRAEFDGLPLHTNRAGYTVPDVTYNDPQNRRLRVVTIGAGFSGILLAYKLAREAENIEHVIYEKNGDIGGAWLENRYPNCACDVPSHSYVYDFALNPYWPELYSKSDHIWKYLDRVCRVFDLRKYMQFNSKIVEAVWNEDIGKWRVEVEVTYADESTEIVVDQCDVLLQASGQLNNPKMPDIKGIEAFKGRVIHTAQWPDEYGPEQWKGQRVAIIGAGASSVQTTPGLQPHVEHIDLFVRSKAWLASAQGETKAKSYFTVEEQAQFASDQSSMVRQARIYEEKVNMVWRGMMSYTPEQAKLVERSRKTMEKYLEKPHLIEGFVPGFAVGCRRTTPGVSFMQALKEPNVEVHFTGVDRITEYGIIGADGTTATNLDTIVCATGFDTSYRPRFPLIGQNGVSMSEKYSKSPDSYFGVSAPDFPNYILLFGPSFPVLAGSVTASLTAVADLAIAMIRKIQVENLRSIAPKQKATEMFNEHVQTMLHGTVWEDNCSSWYKNKDGRITAVWPGSALHYQEVIRNPRWEDWEIEYMNPHNMFAYLGLGFTRIERNPEADKAPYMNLGRLNPEFYDFEAVPLRKEPSPTAAEARKLSLKPRPNNGKKQITMNGDVPVPETGYENGKVGHLKGFTAVLNFEDGLHHNH